MTKTMSDKTTKVQLIGFLPALTLLFIALKLCGVIDWWWILVLGPLWIPPVAGGLFAVAILAFFLVLSFTCTFLENTRKR